VYQYDRSDVGLHVHTTVSSYILASVYVQYTKLGVGLFRFVTGNKRSKCSVDSL